MTIPYQHPHCPLLDGPTPLQHLPRLSRAIGGVEVFVKRDDLMGIALGGNKLRKLEFLLGAAQAEGADTFITVGARQSNHARLSAAAAARAGLKCELVLTRSVPRFDDEYLWNGNVLLDDLFGAHVHDLPAGSDALAFAQARAAVLAAEGRRAYVCPVGGSTPLGSLGYVVCADEIMAQAKVLGMTFDEVIVPNGSGGTHAGLAAGFAQYGADAPPLLAFSVSGRAEIVRASTLAKARETAQLLDPAPTVAEDAVRVDDTQIGAGYGIPTDAMRAAVRLMATTEGVLLDPVYSGKALAGLQQRAADGVYRSGARVLFVMTGGAPGIFAYRGSL
jgi:D-cysteine desulfhydrase